MKIAIIGYGKMGKTIERIAIERGHEIVSIIDADNQADFDSDSFRTADVAIEFTTPSTAVSNYKKAFSKGVKVVSGSTGWTDRMSEIKDLCDKEDATFFWTSNFSIGVNLFFAINNYVAHLMNGFRQYTPHITEIHHIHKLDHPSGTAISIANGITDNNASYDKWSETSSSEAGTVRIDHIREGEVPGTHTVSWDSAADRIELTHIAKSREGFALGAVIAAEWVAEETGFLTMDMLMKRITGLK